MLTYFTDYENLYVLYATERGTYLDFSCVEYTPDAIAQAGLVPVDNNYVDKHIRQCSEFYYDKSYFVDLYVVQVLGTILSFTILYNDLSALTVNGKEVIPCI